MMDTGSRYYRLVLFMALALVLGTGIVLGVTVATAWSQGQGSRADVYELWRVSPDAPLSVRFKGTCIEAEDSAAHLRLVEYSRGEVVFGCQRGGY